MAKPKETIEQIREYVKNACDCGNCGASANRERLLTLLETMDIEAGRRLPIDNLEHQPPDDTERAGDK